MTGNSKMALPTKPGNTDRGWNDPPMFLYVDQAGDPRPATPKRSHLTKRVPFPNAIPGRAQNQTPNTPPQPGTATPPLRPTLPSGDNPQPGPASNVQPALHGNVVLLPPKDSTAVPTQPIPILVPSKQEIESERTELNAALNSKPSGLVPKISLPDFQDDEQLFHYVFTRLEKVLRQVVSNLKAREADDIKRRLEVFQSMWHEGKISHAVKTSMAKLSLALGKRNCDLAHELHLGLMMDYISEVGQWMVGIKRLIKEARQVPPISPDKYGDDDMEWPPYNPASPPEGATDTNDEQTASQPNVPETTTKADSNAIKRNCDTEVTNVEKTAENK